MPRPLALNHASGVRLRHTPNRLTTDTHERIVDLVRRGLPLGLAASATGVTVTAVDQWMTRGLRTAREPYFSFALDVNKARAELAEGLVAKLRGANEWQASAWLLERNYPSHFSRPQRVEHTGAGGGPMQQQIVIYQLPDNGRGDGPVTVTGTRLLSESEESEDEDIGVT